MSATRVVNVRHTNDYDVYIGRGSQWGNPYTTIYPLTSHARFLVGSREEAIEGYEGWIRSQPELLEQLPQLRGRILGCYCKPLACHGDVIARLADA